jgi:DNA-binding transcriptional MerR regulator
MGSVFEYVTIGKAMEALEISRSQLYRYIRRGHLTTVKKGQQQLVSRKDIQTLLDLRNSGNPPYAINKTTIARLDAEVRMLRKQLDTVMRILDLRHDPIKLTAPELLSIYRMANHFLTQPWSPHDEESWSDTFIRIQLSDFEKMSEITQDEHPWRPFYSLVKAMFENPHDEGKKLIFSAGKANLERIAHIWCQTIKEGDAKSMDRLIREDDKQVRKICRKIQHIKRKNQ